jgi:hypothetical protein
MEMKRISRDSPDYGFVRQLLDNISCVVCSETYDEEDVAVVGQQEQMWMLMVSCHHCGTQGIVLAMVKEDEEIEIVTDLTPEELEQAKGLPKITSDDVLDVYEFLRDFDGDFIQLLGQDFADD